MSYFSSCFLFRAWHSPFSLPILDISLITQISIRPLQTSDLRVRKFSGRHQISADGKHLIDGVAFGRPFLKRADRPAVSIQPRKRKRITYEEEDDSFVELENNDKQVAIRVGFEDADDGSDGDESEDDEDFDPDLQDDGDSDGGAGVDEGLEDELEGLHNDLQPGEDETLEDKRGSRARSRKKKGEKGTGLGLDLGGGAYHNPLLDKYSQDEPLARPPALKAPSKKPKDKRNLSNPKIRNSIIDSQRIERRGSAESVKSVRFEDGMVTMPATVIEAAEQDASEDDEDFDPTGHDSSTDLDESDKENAEPAEDASSPSGTSDSSSSTPSELDHSDNELEESTSSSGTSSSSSDSESDSAPKQLSSKVMKRVEEEKKLSQSSSTSLSGSKPGSEIQDNRKSTKSHGTPKVSVGETSMELTEKTPIPQPPVPPGGGKQSTRMRNMRRKASAALKYWKSNGDLDDKATIEDLIRLKEERGTSIPPWMAEMRSKLDSSPPDDMTDKQNDRVAKKQDMTDVAARKEALLRSLQSQGGIDVSVGLQQTYEGYVLTPEDKRQTERDDAFSGSQTRPAGSSSDTIRVPDSLPKDVEPTPVTAQSTKIQPADIPLPSSTPPNASPDTASLPQGSQRQRSKLDLATSKRMLFGSLGLKTPKTKDEESALRERLMKDIGPTRPVKDLVAEIEAAESGGPSDEDKEDNWKDKIELMAVECCHDDIVLSTPPFPFVQRWDPQQQGVSSRKKGKKGKKRKRMDQSYDTEMHEESAIPSSPSKIARQESYDPNMEQPQFDAQAFDQDEALGSQAWSKDQGVQDSAAASEQLLRETEAVAIYGHAETKSDPEPEDLLDIPELPEDPTQCTQLQQQHCLAGAVIAFKRFLMSADTNWQPGISDYTVVLVDEMKDNGTLVVNLARRDQPKRRAQYHKETGERLYSKFEMPGFDEEDASIDSQRLEMPFDELISPILIRSAPDKLYQIEEKAATASPKPDDTLVGDEAQRPAIETRASPSFDSNLENSASLESEIVMPTGSARQQIVDMIQDAGWRSSPGPDIGKTLDVNGHHKAAQVDGCNEDARSLRSPTSTNVEASPHVNGLHSVTSPLSATIQSSEEPQSLVLNADHTEGGRDKAVVRYPALPDDNEESGPLQHQRQHRSVSLDTDLQRNSQGFISPPPTRRNVNKPGASGVLTTQSQKHAEKGSKPIGTFDAANDSDEFPKLFSQAFEAHMSRDVIVKDENSQTFDINRLPTKKRKQGSSRKGKRGKYALPGSDEEDNGSSNSHHSSQTQVPQSSQIVDLTISSQPLDSAVLGEDDHSLSSGWLDQPEPKKDVSVAKRSSRRKTRSASILV